MRRIRLQALSAANSTQKDQKAAIAHDWFPTLFPHLEKWRNEYVRCSLIILLLDSTTNTPPFFPLRCKEHGILQSSRASLSKYLRWCKWSVFLYSTGNLQLLCTTDMEMVKEIGLHKSLSLGKPSYLTKDRGPLFGQGILSSSGPIWAHQRKIIAPQFFPDRVKGMVNLMVDATTSLLKSWESRVEGEGGLSEITVDEDLRSLSADIISRACFGSNYSKGVEIFLKLKHSKWPCLRQLLGFQVVKQRIEEATHEKDLLQMILDGAKAFDDYKGLSKERFIVDNCKNMYFAGYETTATTASWTLMLLAAHPDWQARVRSDVLETCKGSIPDADALRNMKTLTMTIQETLRLYPPATFVIRQALEDIDFKGIMIPKDIYIQIPIPTLQQSLELCGPDAHEFNPERFANGIVEACKISQAYMPFGLGARICAGQHFAIAELKVVLSLLLSRFSFSLSPAYLHSPAFRLVLQPEHGVCLHVKRV
ncbi:hypothetical protein CRYUN_Cryun01aG0253800 [Craigia yunnanensis]